MLFAAMTPRVHPKLHPGVSPDWANLPRRHCDECGKKYKPVRPLREGERGFCCDNHRKSYHKHGGAYRKLKEVMERMLDKALQNLRDECGAIIQREVHEEFLRQKFQAPAEAKTLQERCR